MGDSARRWPSGGSTYGGWCLLNAMVPLPGETFENPQLVAERLVAQASSE